MNEVKKRQKLSPAVSFGITAAVIVVIYVLALVGVFSSNTLRIMLNMCLYCSVANMWNLMSGHCGLTSLGQQVFIGLAGYTLTVTTATYGLSYWVAILAGAILCGVLALLLSLVFFRIKGMYFAVATWIAAEAMKTIFTSWSFVKQGAGMTVKISPYPKNLEIFLLAFSLAIITSVVCQLLLRSRTGLGLSAMGDDPDAAASLGVNIKRSKLICFVLSGAFTGVAGVIFYLNKGSIFPTGGFDISWTVAIVFIVIIGGVGTFAGPIVGAVIYVMLYEYLSAYVGTSNIILGAIAIIVILTLPNGLVGTIQNKFGFEIMSLRRYAPEEGQEEQPQEDN